MDQKGWHCFYEYSVFHTEVLAISVITVPSEAKTPVDAGVSIFCVIHSPTNTMLKRQYKRNCNSRKRSIVSATYG